jgi:hypothetical protein
LSLHTDATKIRNTDAGIGRREMHKMDAVGVVFLNAIGILKN